MLSACQHATRTPGGIAIEVLCREWERSLPSRSVQDTQQTQDEIGHAYNVYQAACEDGLP